MAKDWWIDEETTDRHVADLIVEALDADEDWDEFEEFSDAHDSIPVALMDGMWWVLDSRGLKSWETGVTADDTTEEASTLGELASALNLSPSTLAADYGWPSDSWPIEFYEKKFSKVSKAVKRRMKRMQDARREAREEARLEREEVELFDREQREERAKERGETLTYAPGGMTVEQAAFFLGMPEDSQTVRLYVTRMLDTKEALRRARKITHRHESTDYERLLAAGIDRDTARALIE